MIAMTPSLLPPPRDLARYSFVECGCGAMTVFAIAFELAATTDGSAHHAVTRAAMGLGWLLYAQVGAWACPRCVRASDTSSSEFQWAVAARRNYLARVLET